MIKQASNQFFSCQKIKDDFWWSENKPQDYEIYRSYYFRVSPNRFNVLDNLVYFPNRVVEFLQSVRSTHGDVISNESALDILNFIFIEVMKNDSIRRRPFDSDTLVRFQTSDRLDCRIDDPPTITSIIEFYRSWYSEFLKYFKKFILPISLWTKTIPNSNEYVLCGFVSRMQAESMMIGKKQRSFFLRFSESVPGQVVLVLKSIRKIYHILITGNERTPCGCTVSFEDGVDREFDNIWDFILHYDDAMYYMNEECKRRPNQMNMDDYDYTYA